MTLNNTIKKIIPSIKKVGFESIMSILTVLAETGFELYVPLVMAKLIDSGLEKNDMSMIKYYGILTIILVFVQSICGMACVHFAVNASTGFAADLRAKVFSHVQTFAFANIDKFTTGSLVTRSTTDITNIQRSFQMTIRGIFRSLALVVFSLVCVYNIDIKFANLYLLSIPIILGSFAMIVKLAYPLFKKMFESFDKLNNTMSENIHAIRVVKAFNRQKYEFDKMNVHNTAITDNAYKAQKIMVYWDPFINIAIYGLLILVAWLGAKAIIASGNDVAQGLTTGKLMSLVTYGMQLMHGLIFCSFIAVGIVMASASVSRVSEVLDEETVIKNCESPIYTIKDNSIEFRDVTFKYNVDKKGRALKNVNIKINSGDTIGIIGGTGSGKSSFVNLIPRLYDATEGQVLIGGIDIKNYDLATLRKYVGICLQRNVLFSGTIESNLKMGNENATKSEIIEACDIACASEFINEKEGKYNEVVEQGGANFSGGQKQRLSIARTIIKKPQIIIFDDSTSAIDTKTDKKIRTGLRTLMDGVTKIIVSQRIVSIIDCDKIVVLDNGRVVGYDTHASLLENCDIYKEIYEIQCK